MATDTTTENGPSSSQEAQTHVNATTEYCAKTQEWTYCMTLTTFHFSPCNFPVVTNYQAQTGTPWPAGQPTLDARYGTTIAPPNTGTQTGQQMTAWTPPHDTRRVQQQNGNAPETSLEYTTPSPHHRFLAETVDFFILFCVKLWSTGCCFFEIFWGLGGATPGKILLGLQVVTCDSSVLVRPNRVLVVPPSNVTLPASVNFSIAFLFSIFTTFFFQHNRTVYDIVAGTIVVEHRGVK
uniref:Family with sequence similarity 8 member A1a n=1 Tax=Oncorhynchus kisutch TaxID=8019 RepID=A0A8C7E029_ONCKI